MGVPGTKLYSEYIVFVRPPKTPNSKFVRSSRICLVFQSNALPHHVAGQQLSPLANKGSTIFRGFYDFLRVRGVVLGQLCRHVHRKISAHVDGGLSGGSRVHRPVSKASHRRQRKLKFFCDWLTKQRPCTTSD